MTQLGIGYKPGDVVSASHSFYKDRHEDLSFRQHEQLRIINISKDPNWAHAENSNGETGLIPLNHVTFPSFPLEELKCYQWFHGRISRAESEKILAGHPPGSFMVRHSDLFTGDLTLCVVGLPMSTEARENNMNGPSGYQSDGASDDLPTINVQHYHIICKQGASGETAYTLDEFDWFTSLPDLIDFYSVPDSGLAAPLQYPVADLLRERLKRLRESGWIISRKDLVLGDEIGCGEFGDVLRATYNHTDVAVKICKKSVCKLAITYEAALMTNLRHPNLISFVGLVYEPEDNAIYLVTEYLARGSLLAYLHSRTRDEVTDKEKLQFTTDVCRGMAYLEERGVIHRDVAARNILLSGGFPRIVAKIADFGMARDLSHSTPYSLASVDTSLPNGSIYTGSRPIRLSPSSDGQLTSLDSDSLDTLNNLSLRDNTAIPIKWSAPEAVRRRQFTIKSDVWSFGILLWEIYSYGRIPYPRMLASQVLPQLKAGYRMKAPEGCPPEIYRLMRQTWEFNPDARPSFATMLSELSSQLSSLESATVERVLRVRTPSSTSSRTPMDSGTFVVKVAPRAEMDEDPWFARTDRRRSMSNGHSSLRITDTDALDVRPGFTAPRNSRQYHTLTRAEAKRMSRSFTITSADANSCVDDGTRTNGSRPLALYSNRH